MFNLSTQDVVLSIEKAPLKVVRGIIYQEYANFFGNTYELDFGKKENFEKLENQTQLNRVKLSKDNEVMKKLTVFFMNTTITKTLEKKFNTTLKFDSVDVWIDGKGYKLPPHVDDSRIKLHLQVYLSNNNEGTSLYDSTGELLYTFPFKANYGYALYNGVYSHHGVEEIENDDRTSLYVRYQ
tara:strand:- start:3142 stop:3687 length:546 start_codon:yes stop_codon:yes gene_type:complete